jgi:AAA15 family ATPase/GTPase
MLIELKIKNYLSFKNEAQFLMTSVKSFKEHLDTNVIKTGKEFDLLKTVAIYGVNGGGKSNFIGALKSMGRVVLNSYSNSLKKDDERPNQNFQFRLNSKTENANTMFEVSFLMNSDIFRYGFEINGFEIKKEWLYRKIEREVPLFIREGEYFEINSESFAEGEKYKSDVNSNVLFISHLAQNNQNISKQVLIWFKNINVISGLHEDSYSQFTATLLEKDLNFKKWAATILKYMEISNIEAGEKDGEIITYHNKYDKNDLLIEAIPFKAKFESEGTKKLIHILGPIYDTVRGGRILLIDEFDTKLHPNLSKRLINLFHKLNKTGAQIIISGNDTNLLDKNIFRRDQIWFIDKDQFGASEIYSLSEFDAKTVRNTSSFDKKYLNNDFGAANPLEIKGNLISLLYES